MEKRSGRIFLTYAGSLLVVLFLDLITKSLAEKLLENRILSPLPFLHFVLVYNRGIAFGLLAEAPDFLRVPVLLFAPLVALVITFLYAIKSTDRWTPLLMGMVAGGALGNLYDRAFLGQVRDFIYLSYGGFSWPAFNLADASISIAILLFLVRALFHGSGKR